MLPFIGLRRQECLNRRCRYDNGVTAIWADHILPAKDGFDPLESFLRSTNTDKAHHQRVRQLVHDMLVRVQRDNHECQVMSLDQLVAAK